MDDNEEDNEEDDFESMPKSTSEKIFGKVVKKPYLHYLITSRIDYMIRNESNSSYKSKYKSIVIKNPSNFKGFYGVGCRIFAAENGTILFCGCHHYPESDSIIQPFKRGYVSYDVDDEDHESFDYELPNKPFKHLFKFMGQITTKARDVRVNNFEILTTNYNSEIRSNPQKYFKVGNISLPKLIPSCVEERIENERKAKRREMLELNFDKRDDWSNVKPHCHALNEHDEGPMPLPEFRINHKYYSTHIIYKSFEPLRKMEHLQSDNMCPNTSTEIPDKLNYETNRETSLIRKAYDYIMKMIENCRMDSKVVTQFDIFQKLRKLAPDLYNMYLEGEVTPVFKTG